MNVGQLLRSILSEAQPGEPKTLELKVGQVVKGLVLQLLSEQDALVNIGGVQVKAHLETPLKQGEVTMLQVQPESANGQIILKPLANSTVEIADESLADILKNMGLKDTSANRQVIQMLHQANISLTKENSQAFVKVLAEIPTNAQPEQWQQSALLAIQNNLPITLESVSALHQVVYGTPINQQLDQLAQQMDEALKNPAISKQASETFSQIKGLLNELQAISTQAFPTSANESEAVSKGTAGLNVMTAAQAQAENSGNPKNALNATNPLLTDVPKSSVSLEKGVNLGNNANKASSFKEDSFIKDYTQVNLTKAEVSIELEKAIKLPIMNNASIELEKAIKPPIMNNASIELDKAEKLPVMNNNAAGQSQSSALNEAESLKTQTIEAETPQWIGKWLKSLGVEHEQQLFKALDKAPALDKFIRRADGTILEFEFTPEGNRNPNEAAKQVVTDSLKAALLQLNAFDDISPAMKESTQQLLQQITGQQLLLTPDRTSMFSHITMMIPMNNEQGQQTAAVHIQSRKGSRGEIDANNCRLVFDLRMKSIGETLVDVQVFNKIVSVHVHNDHDFVANLLEGSRDEIAASLQNVGYQFLSLKCSPFPEDTSELAASTQEAVRNPNASYYATKPYKGVDLRV
jgi:hypothetical protein